MEPWTEWKNCEVTDCKDGTWRAAVKRRKVMIVQYGETDEDAFDRLSDLVHSLDKNYAARTVVTRPSTIENETIKV